jgi:hypothetical protein
MIRKTFASTLLILLIGTPAWAYVHRESVEKEIPVEGRSIIRIANPNGLIQLRPGGEGEIVLDARKIAKAEGEDAARDLAAEARVRVVEGSDEIEIRVEIPSKIKHSRSLGELLGFSKRKHVTVELYVDVPPSMEVILSTASGDVDVEGVLSGGEIGATSGDVWVSDCRGDFEIGVASGDVEIEGIIGELKLSASSGEISVKDISGSVEVSAASGDFVGEGIGESFSLDGASGSVSLEGCGGKVEISTASGDVWLKDVTSEIHVNTSSGDVTAYAVNGGPVDVNISCSSGDVELTIPVGGSYTLEISSVSGSINTKVPLSVQKVTRHELRGEVGSGEGSVSISTSSGDIKLLES